MANRTRALTLALIAGACTVPALGAPSVTGVGAVTVRAVRFVPEAPGGPGLAGGATVVVTTLELTNASARRFVPDVSRFFLTADDGERYQGTASGSSVFAGVSNPRGALEPGAARDYTVGFRSADPVVAGTVSYEP